jgi:hypothetical protein
MEYIWFWTFWHWSKESFRSRMVLRGPLHGIASHWDEWFRHEASEDERRSIANIGKSESGQRRFILWLCRHWVREASLNPARLITRFVLGQLAHMPPFNAWVAFAPFRTGYGHKGVQAIVLADKSAGEPRDVRNVEALILPPDPDPTAPGIVTEEFQAETADLQPVFLAAKSLLSGRGLCRFLWSWVISGRRPYPRWVAVGLFLGWLAVGGLLMTLLFGPEPGERLLLLAGLLIGLWLGLILVEVAAVGFLTWRAWHSGVALTKHLENNQVRLRMNGGLILKGGSAGLPFCLSMLSSLYRAHPQDARGSWLWQQFFRKLNSEGEAWAATGVLTADGRLKPVVLAPKLRACLNHGRVKQILTPNQPDASNAAAGAFSNASIQQDATTRAGEASPGSVKFGFAAEMPQLHLHRCGHIAKAVMILGGFVSRSQTAFNAFAVAVSVIILVGLPDLLSILLPPAAPIPVAPTSPTPYELWVSLDTKQPQYFNVVLESDYWSNRRVEVSHHTDVMQSVRAVILFHRTPRSEESHEDNGVVWIERRRRFLTREFFPGERVGRYSIPYLARLGRS